MARGATSPHGELTAALLRRAVAELALRDARLGAVVDRIGPPPLWARPPGFATLVRIILEQQVSLASGRAAYSRLQEVAGRVTPRQVAGLRPGDLTAAGLTRQKAGYCLGLARRVVAGEISLGSLSRLPDEEARAALVAVPGIGPWTADVYLLMALRRPDVWPSGDLALEKAAQEVTRLRARPDRARLRRMARRWAPWRAVAARVLWHHYLDSRRRSA